MTLAEVTPGYFSNSRCNHASSMFHERRPTKRVAGSEETSSVLAFLVSGSGEAVVDSSSSSSAFLFLELSSSSEEESESEDSSFFSSSSSSDESESEDSSFFSSFFSSSSSEESESEDSDSEEEEEDSEEDSCFFSALTAFSSCFLGLLGLLDFRLSHCDYRTCWLNKKDKIKEQKELKSFTKEKDGDTSKQLEEWVPLLSLLKFFTVGTLYHYASQK